MTEQPVIVTAPASNLPPVLKAQASPNGAESANGSPSHAPAHRGKPRQSKLSRRLTLGGIVVGLIGVAGFFYWLTTPAKAQRTDLILEKVKFEPLNLTVVERGALESADNREVVCRVKAG